MTQSLTPELREFIYAHVPTVLGLEGLLAIYGDPGGSWTPERLDGAVPDLTLPGAEDLLASLHWHGFLAAGPPRTFVYRPRSVELAKRTNDLAKLYAERPAVVLAEIARLETLSGVRSFADAFRIRKNRGREPE